MSTRVEVLLWAGRVIARKGGQPHELLEIPADAGLEQAQEAFHKLARIAHPDLHRTTLDAAEMEKVTTAYAYAAAAYQEMRIAAVRGRAPAHDRHDKPAEPAAADKTGEIPRVKRTSEPARTVRLPGGGLVRGTVTSRPQSTTKSVAPPSSTLAPPPSARSAATAPPVATTTPPPSRVGTQPLPRTTGSPAPNPAALAPPGEPMTPMNPSSAMNSKALVYYRKAELALRQGDLRMAVLNLKMAIAADPASQFLRSAIAEVEAELKGGK